MFLEVGVPWRSQNIGFPTKGEQSWMILGSHTLRTSLWSLRTFGPLHIKIIREKNIKWYSAIMEGLFKKTYLFLTFKAVSHTRSPEADAFLAVTQRFKQIKDLSARVRCLCWGETANIMGFWWDWIARHLDVPVFLLFCSCCFPPYYLILGVWHCLTGEWLYSII